MLKEIKALKSRGYKSFRNELSVGDDVSLSPPRSGSDYDYDELEKEYGEDSLSNVGGQHSLKKNGNRNDETSKHISFLDSSKELHKKTNYTEEILDNLIDEKGENRSPGVNTDLSS